MGAVVNVITKSGTNRFEGSAKYIATNDEWNSQNKTKNQVTGASLERVKFDKVNPTWSFTLGGPLWPDHAWFFGAYEKAESVSPQRQAVVTREEFQESLESPFWNVRLTGQVTPSHTVWAKYHESPTNGFMIDYWSGSRTPLFAGDLEAMTRQDQGADSYAFQWTGVFGSNFSAEAMYADNDEFINVFPFRVSPLHGGAPHESEADGLYYNGATFTGFVVRPREQATLAASYFADFGSNSHSFKAGFDWQHLASGARFAYPNDQYFFDESFNAANRTFVPLERYDFDPAQDSTSESDIYSLYVRDKFEVGDRLFFEIGARYEKQEGQSDIGETTVDAATIAPRLSGAFDVRGDGKSLITATYGRFYQFILQGFSDSFANVPQQGNYDVFVWDGTQYVFNSRVESGANALARNTNLDPTFTDEITLGFQHQIGNVIGLGVRGIYREWGDLIDDIRRFSDDPSGPTREFVNYDPAERKYTGIEFTFEKRFSRNWNASLSYTYSETEGNHFANSSSSLGDFLEGNCRTTVDPTVGTIPCREVQDGRNKFGNPGYDRPHNVKAGGAYSLPLGPVSLTLGLGGEYISATTYEKQRSVTILNPRTGASSGTATYFYNERGGDRLDPLW
ncbi:MAG: TonB-dependent receptor plug domain-containing protein, partial [Thermoplasmata archaeon]